MNIEEQRINYSPDNKTWKKWGPYLAERQWGTVREDYGVDGNAWRAVSHDHARSNAYRWGEEGIAGFCDHHQIICVAPAFWNGEDPIIKERLFGLTNDEGNHGEDVKELYYYLESTPTHSYCKMLYKYPHKAFPYNDLVTLNQKGKDVPEFEILDTKIFDNNEYFDIYLEYAKGGIDDFVLKITVHNRGDKEQPIHVLPHVWFRNYWKHNNIYNRPLIESTGENSVKVYSSRMGTYYFYHQGGEQLFCENETNNERIYKSENEIDYVKDGINNFIVDGQEKAINPKKKGTKCAVWMKGIVPAGKELSFKVRLSLDQLEDPFLDFDEVLFQRKRECDKYYAGLSKKIAGSEYKKIQRSAIAGLMWTKQFYYYDVHKWWNGENGKDQVKRAHSRNLDWQHLTNRNVLSMPDKWEYPWYAAWDLAFHATSFAYVDPEFAKRQLSLMLREYYLHPNGQIPAYEWNFSDVNPPVHAWAVWEVYNNEKILRHKPDYDFLERAFQKLLMNFTWWVNQKDKNGSNLFEGGFLGLDNIGVFDRNQLPAGIKNLEQADATSWMALFSLNMLRISLELATINPAYEESASKFFRHFLDIAWAMHHMGGGDVKLWDDRDAFFYDVVQRTDGSCERLRVRSLVGIIPLFAVEVISSDLLDELAGFKRRAIGLIRNRPDLAELISRIEEQNKNGEHLISLLRGYRLEHVIKKLLDESEFLSDYGIRSLSKFHQDNPYHFESHGEKHTISYEPGESSTNMFGGNSNWRGPIWFPINYLIIRSLRKYARFYGEEYTYEYPTGSGNKLPLNRIADELSKRLLRIFEIDDTGKYRYMNLNVLSEQLGNEFAQGTHLFYEYFNGETGEGLGASHQTGWTALVANLLFELES